MKRIFTLAVLTATVAINSGCKKSTNATLPLLTTDPVTDITISSATSGGNITSDGNATITSRGICWGTSSGPAVSGSKTSDGNGVGQFTSTITGLAQGTLYYVRAYAENKAGTAYGDELTFTTGNSQQVVITTASATLITSTTAMSGGNITDDGGSSITGRGVCWSTSSSPTVSASHTSDGTGTGSFSSNLSGLSPATKYFVRAYALNSLGTAYGNEVSFTTNSAQSGNDVSIQGMAFVPSTITVPVNTTVKWTNNDPIAHTVTSDASLFDSGSISPGGTFSHQFTTTGTFNYHCSIHLEMTAKVIVQ